MLMRSERHELIYRSSSDDDGGGGGGGDGIYAFVQ
jgi:hypothetical protein